MNPVLSTQLGTRHRAAIGITEETDAVAVIISEETGMISMAVAGSIERELTVERLRERLSALLRRYAPRHRCRVRWRKVLSKRSRPVRVSPAGRMQGCGREGRLTMPELHTAQFFAARTFVHNMGLKVVSLLLAIALVRGGAESIAEVEMKVPIEFHNLPDNLEIDSASFTEAQIRVRGPERVIHQLQATDVHAGIDLAGVIRGSGPLI